MGQIQTELYLGPFISVDTILFPFSPSSLFKKKCLSSPKDTYRTYHEVPDLILDILQGIGCGENPGKQAGFDIVGIRIASQPTSLNKRIPVCRRPDQPWIGRMPG